MASKELEDFRGWFEKDQPKFMKEFAIWTLQRDGAILLCAKQGRLCRYSQDSGMGGSVAMDWIFRISLEG